MKSRLAALVGAALVLAASAFLFLGSGLASPAHHAPSHVHVTGSGTAHRQRGAPLQLVDSIRLRAVDPVSAIR